MRATKWWLLVPGDHLSALPDEPTVSFFASGTVDGNLPDRIASPQYRPLLDRERVEALLTPQQVLLLLSHFLQRPPLTSPPLLTFWHDAVIRTLPPLAASPPLPVCFLRFFPSPGHGWLPTNALGTLEGETPS